MLQLLPEKLGLTIEDYQNYAYETIDNLRVPDVLYSWRECSGF